MAIFIILIISSFIIGIIGYANYKSTVERGKKIYCDINCNENDTECDFLHKEEKLH